MEQKVPSSVSTSIVYISEWNEVKVQEYCLYWCMELEYQVPLALVLFTLVNGTKLNYKSIVCIGVWS